MRISEDRYTRDLRRIQLAQRFIRHEVRTQSVCAWTGLSDERIRNLCRSYGASVAGAQRHRGPSPRRLASFLRSPRLRSEASALGALAYALSVIPRERIPDARRNLPGIEAGERLCHAFELYRRIVPQSHVSLDQVILVVIALADGTDLTVGHCGQCHGALLLDRLSHTRRLCPTCKKQDSRQGPSETPELCAGEARIASDDAAEVAEPSDALQQPLF
jgi:hypothetical protein